jgi:hypothetical protein
MIENVNKTFSLNLLSQNVVIGDAAMSVDGGNLFGEVEITM